MPADDGDERADWARVAAVELARAYSDKEPEYGPQDIKPNRVLAVILGVGYLLLIAAAFHTAANWSYGVALLVTIVGAAIIMATLAALGVRVYRMYRSKGSCVRFSFSTIFLVSIPLSVYLAGIRVFVQRAPWQEIGFGGMLFILVLGASWMIISTAILLCLAEAIVAMAVGIFRWRRRMFPGHCSSI